jgi:hypothetical protein
VKTDVSEILGAGSVMNVYLNTGEMQLLRTVRPVIVILRVQKVWTAIR